jgi:hypothetical protein
VITDRARHIFGVMPALVAGIHVFVCFKTWMAGTKPGHDE